MEFLIFRKYTEKDSVEILTNILSEHNIEFEVAEDRESLDSLYGGSLLTKQFYGKIKNADFKKADELLLSISEKELGSIDKDIICMISQMKNSLTF